MFNHIFNKNTLCIFLSSIVSFSCVAGARQTETTSVEEKVVVVQPLKKEINRWKCKDCTPQEKETLDFLQENGIVDKAALATIMGNIKQESKFNANICEGGSRVPYNLCHVGGYGLIQWTTSRRYIGLGQFAKRHNCDPSSLKCQLRYMVTERQWKIALSRFKVPNQSISYYMKGAYWWLGWGIHGERTKYSFQYLNRLFQG